MLGIHIQILRQKKVVWLSKRTGLFVIALIEAARMENELMPLAILGSDVKGSKSRRIVQRSVSARIPKNSSARRGISLRLWSFHGDPDGHTLELSFGEEAGLTVETDR